MGPRWESFWKQIKIVGDTLHFPSPGFSTTLDREMKDEKISERCTPAETGRYLLPRAQLQFLGTSETGAVSETLWSWKFPVSSALVAICASYSSM